MTQRCRKISTRNNAEGNEVGGFAAVPVAAPLIDIPALIEEDDQEVQVAEIGGDSPLDPVSDAVYPIQNSTPGMVTRAAARKLGAVYCGYVDTKEMERTFKCHKITLQKAMRKYKDEAMGSCIKELKQLDDSGLLKPVDYAKLSAQQKKKIIGTFMFLNEKYLPNGDFDKLKARLVAMGNQQDVDDLNMLISAPTVSTTHVFACAALFAAEECDVAMVDIGGAFTEAVVPDDIEVHVLLDKVNARLLIELRPEYTKYLRPNGSMVVKLLRALYGCLMSARLWYDRLTSVLERQDILQTRVIHLCLIASRMESDRQYYFMWTI